MEFEWDSAKNESNRKKHGIAFEEVRELFTGGADFLEVYDDEHSDEEDRFIAIGPVSRGVVLVAYTEPREGVVRIISVRWATKTETRLFQQHVGGQDE